MLYAVAMIPITAVKLVLNQVNRGHLLTASVNFSTVTAHLKQSKQCITALVCDFPAIFIDPKQTQAKLLNRQLLPVEISQPTLFESLAKHIWTRHAALIGTAAAAFTTAVTIHRLGLLGSATRKSLLVGSLPVPTGFNPLTLCFPFGVLILSWLCIKPRSTKREEVAHRTIEEANDSKKDKKPTPVTICNLETEKNLVIQAAKATLVDENNSDPLKRAIQTIESDSACLSKFESVEAVCLVIEAVKETLGQDGEQPLGFAINEIEKQVASLFEKFFQSIFDDIYKNLLQLKTDTYKSFFEQLDKLETIKDKIKKEHYQTIENAAKRTTFNITSPFKVVLKLPKTDPQQLASFQECFTGLKKAYKLLGLAEGTLSSEWQTFETNLTPLFTEK